MEAKRPARRFLHLSKPEEKEVQERVTDSNGHMAFYFLPQLIMKVKRRNQLQTNLRGRIDRTARCPVMNNSRNKSSFVLEGNTQSAGPAVKGCCAGESMDKVTEVLPPVRTPPSGYRPQPDVAPGGAKQRLDNYLVRLL